MSIANVPEDTLGDAYEYLIGRFADDGGHTFTDEPGFCRVADLERIAANGHSLSIPLYVKRPRAETGKPEDQRTLREVWDDWEQDGRAFWQQVDALVETLDGLLCENDSPNR